MPQQEHQVVFRQLCDLSGVTGYEFSPTIQTNARSVLGVAADDYLWAHGYQQGSVNLIKRIYERTGRMDTFADQLSMEGVPVAEARYIYSLIQQA